MIKTVHTTRRRERGAVLIQVAVAMVALLAFGAIVIDYGVMWTARGQIQTSADAGALAGAIARAYDDPNNPPLANGIAYNAAFFTAQQNKIWGGTPTAIQLSWSRPNGVPASIQGKFVKVDVFRNGANGSTFLPTYLLPLVGLTTQGVRGTAMAVAAAANGTSTTSNCMRPWMIPDKWTENTAPTTQFNGADVYTAPDPVTGLGGTGYKVPQDIGTIVTLHPNSGGTMSPSDYFDVDLGGTGGNAYRDNIENGVCTSFGIGTTLTSEPGGKVGPTKQGVDALVQSDPGAYWNAPTLQVLGSNSVVSPRIVPVAIFSPAQYAALGYPSGKFNLTVVNFLGLFVQGVSSKDDVTGVLVSLAGNLNSGGPIVGPGAAFLQKIILVR